MTSNIPDEALHIRGKTLTPESPRPLYISEPSHIPLLQNQMDPAFGESGAYQELFSEKTPSSSDTEHGGIMSEQVHLASHTYTMLHRAVGGSGSNAVGDQGEVSFPESIQTGYHRTETGNESTFSAAHRPASSSQSATHVSETSTDELNHKRAVHTATATATSTSTIPKTSPHLDHLILSENYPSKPYPPSTLPGADYVSNLKKRDFNNNTVEHTPTLSGRHGRNIKSEANTVPDGDSSHPSSLNTKSDSKNIHLSSPTAIANTVASTDDYMTKPLNSDPSIFHSAGLPPRPPPQDKPSINLNYTTTDNIQPFHPLPTQPESGATTQYGQSNYLQSSGLPALVVPPAAPGTSSSLNGLPPPSIPTFQHQFPPSSSAQTKPGIQKFQRGERLGDEGLKFLRGDGDREEPWGPDVQKKYDEFLHYERVYVTEGMWDRFPPGSRLFVGNLPTERVTKRDLFHLFHKYGDLAQISIKQAYGFVQFVEPSACRKALEAEQGGLIRGRKIHLEISKPQKPTRHAPATDSSRPQATKRSRSPDHPRGVPSLRGKRPSSPHRYDRASESRKPPPFREFRGHDDQYRRRDDYRPNRTPSPHGHRRDEYHFRNRTPEKYDRRRDRHRSRSPYVRPGRYRSPSPRQRSYENDSDLPIPRRSLRQVPDVQIIVLENVDREFIYHIESSFQDRGLRTDVLILSPRISLAAVVRRQIIEGVLAIIKLSRTNQYSGKIPLQVFDRSGGSDNVKFNEYSEVEPNIAADVVLQAQTIFVANTSKHPSTQVPPVISQLLPNPTRYQPPQPPLGTSSNITSLISNLDGPALQSLLVALQQNPAALQVAQQQYAPQRSPTGLANILSNLSHQQNPSAPPKNTPRHASQPTCSLPQSQLRPGAGSDTTLASLLAQTIGGQEASQLPQPPPPSKSQAPAMAPFGPQMAPHVQNIMDQLMKWKQ
ncbi:hypothetical protein PAAG_07920 [Paracoccidioides lutzii Pb01]|uniref:RRM domain-containing protein n=1 Tax=Paracoccidioides lutzii (strain ATCC MYA-826 / Pb01) TaxID=502779 RepID=C1HAU1_PARBA|nr:hypothetical protein PAAG_07920 [Paracoccidioides lutzii Pb01]EEH37502.2 hypothetical protein PAAG_07920 [Paracoccidioides lutzii Pb01]